MREYYLIKEQSFPLEPFKWFAEQSIHSNFAQEKPLFAYKAKNQNHSELLDSHIRQRESLVERYQKVLSIGFPPYPKEQIAEAETFLEKSTRAYSFLDSMKPQIVELEASLRVLV